MKLLNYIKYKLGITGKYPSETSKVRHLVLPYCLGYGADIGFGGDKIVKENCVGVDFEVPYANTGGDKVDVACKVGTEPLPFETGTFDYVYSSHLIEDFADTEKILNDFIRVLKDEGNLVLVFPDQQKYEAYCKANYQPLNSMHVHKTMGLEFMKKVMNKIKNIHPELVFESDCEIDYNVIMVYNIKKHGINQTF